MKHRILFLVACVFIGGCGDYRPPAKNHYTVFLPDGTTQSVEAHDCHVSASTKWGDNSQRVTCSNLDGNGILREFFSMPGSGYMLDEGDK